MTRWRALFAVSVLVGLVLTRTSGAAVVSDVQVQPLAGGRWEVIVRSTGPQAFDVAPAARGRRTTIRLHQATLARIAAPARAPFGRVKLRARRDGDVVVRLRLRRGWRADVRQGGSPNLVRVRLAE